MKKLILLLAFIGLIIGSSDAQENVFELKLGNEVVDIEKGIDHKDIRGYLTVSRPANELYSYRIGKLEAFLSENSKAKAQTTGEGSRISLKPFIEAARKGDYLSLKIAEMYAIDKEE